MDPIGVGILIAAVMCFVGIGIWTAVNWGKINYPEGKRVTSYQYRGYEVDVIFGPEVETGFDQDLVAKACATAVWATDCTFLGERLGNIHQVVILFKEDLNLVRDAFGDRFADDSAAYLGHCSQKFGGGVPMPVLKQEYIEEVIEKGEPVIHECLHELMGQTHAPPPGVEEHTEEEVWRNFGKDTYQSRAEALFLRHK